MKPRYNILGGNEWQNRINKFRKALYRFKKNKLTLIGSLIILSIVFIAVFADYIAPYPEDAKRATHFGEQFQPPSFKHIFGTDEAGRDVFSRVIFGSRTSLSAALWVQALVILIGVPLGIIAGYMGGLYSEIIMRTADILLTLPPLALAFLPRPVRSFIFSASSLLAKPRI